MYGLFSSKGNLRDARIRFLRDLAGARNEVCSTAGSVASRVNGAGLSGGTDP